MRYYFATLAFYESCKLHTAINACMCCKHINFICIPCENRGFHIRHRASGTLGVLYYTQAHSSNHSASQIHLCVLFCMILQHWIYIQYGMKMHHMHWKCINNRASRDQKISLTSQIWRWQKTHIFPTYFNCTVQKLTPTKATVTCLHQPLIL